MSEAIADREIAVIARGTYLCTQAVYEVMKRQGGGKIVNISSISGKLGGAVSGSSTDATPAGRSGPAYALAKGGVIAFTKWVAKDAGRYGIHVNACVQARSEAASSAGQITGTSTSDGQSAKSLVPNHSSAMAVVP